jgi:hypothetical protein
VIKMLKRQIVLNGWKTNDIVTVNANQGEYVVQLNCYDVSNNLLIAKKITIEVKEGI